MLSTNLSFCIGEREPGGEEISKKERGKRGAVAVCRRRLSPSNSERKEGNRRKTGELRLVKGEEKESQKGAEELSWQKIPQKRSR